MRIDSFDRLNNVISKFSISNDTYVRIIAGYLTCCFCERILNEHELEFPDIRRLNARSVEIAQNRIEELFEIYERTNKSYKHRLILNCRIAYYRFDFNYRLARILGDREWESDELKQVLSTKKKLISDIVAYHRKTRSPVDDVVKELSSLTSLIANLI